MHQSTWLSDVESFWLIWTHFESAGTTKSYFHYQIVPRHAGLRVDSGVTCVTTSCGDLRWRLSPPSDCSSHRWQTVQPFLQVLCQNERFVAQLNGLEFAAPENLIERCSTNANEFANFFD